jgi:pyridoxine 5-phosphate synthase
MYMTKPVLRLGVNIDHAATLRQARGTLYPDLVEVARLCERAGAKGITIHLREDRRHIQDADVYNLRKQLSVPMNLEMANAPEIVRIALNVCPTEVCLVPEKRRELTTEGGLDVIGHFTALRKTCDALTRAGIGVSLFVDPDLRQLEAAARMGAPYVELHTGAFCDATRPAFARRELARLIEGARAAHALGLRVNAGHGINLATLPSILRLPYLDTLNIGHSIICRAVSVGVERATREMLAGMRAYQGGEP